MESAVGRVDTSWPSKLTLTARTLCLGVALVVFGLAHMYGYGPLAKALATVVAVSLIVLACRGRGGALAWITLVVGLMGFLELRALADDVGMPLHTEDIRRLEELVFFGAFPSLELQRLFFVPGQLSLIDRASAIVYWSYFFAPYFAVLWVWLVRPGQIHELAHLLVLTFAAGLAIYALMPGTPPWLASAQEGAPQIYRIMSMVGSSLDAATYEQVYRSIGDPNPVACLPSVHFAITFMLLLYGFSWGRAWVASGTAYSLAMLWALVYLGEHYVVDCVFGAVVAWAVWYGYRVVPRRGN
ncbi:MAG: phosphatase PAP2 family protein [Chloroflexota bacterium]